MTSTIQSIPVDPTPPASGEGLIFNGTVYVPTPANPGDITAVNTTLPLTGGGVSGALTLDINNFTGDSGAGGLDGAVPAPAAGDAAAGKYLAAGGGWSVPPAGAGDSLLAYLQDNTFDSKNSAVYSDMANMNTGPIATGGGTLDIQFDCTVGSNAGSAGTIAHLQLLVDGVVKAGKAVGDSAPPASTWTQSVTIAAVVTGLAAGNHTISIQWKSASGTVFTNFNEDVSNATILQVWEKG